MFSFAIVRKGDEAVSIPYEKVCYIYIVFVLRAAIQLVKPEYPTQILHALHVFERFGVVSSHLWPMVTAYLEKYF